MKKKILLCPILIFVLLICSACQNPFVYAREPSRQPNTKWMSDDGTIIFTVHAESYMTGEMILDGEIIEFYMSSDFGGGMHLYPIDVLKDSVIDTNDEFEYWLCSYKSKKEFVATVKETTYFEVGQKIAFHRIDENGDVS